MSINIRIKGLLVMILLVICYFIFTCITSDTSYRFTVNVIYTVFQKNGHPFCFCYNFVSRDQILVIFGCLVVKEICNCPLLTYLKEIAGALH